MTSVLIPAPGPVEYAPYYAKYISRVPETNLVEVLAQQVEETRRSLSKLPPERATYRYAPDKWSIVEVVGHMADCERIMAYRALRIARADTTPLPGFEQDDYMATAHFERRSLASMLEELVAVRRTTCMLFENLDAAALERMGTASDNPVSVRALAYIIAGHERHHVAVLRERYGVDA